MREIVYHNELGEVVKIQLPLFDNGMKPTGSAYSDRLFQWDSEKYNRCSEKHFGDRSHYWYNREPDAIQKFLSDYFGFEVILCKVETQKNHSNGYPLWYFEYRRVDDGNS